MVLGLDFVYEVEHFLMVLNHEHVGVVGVLLLEHKVEK